MGESKDLLRIEINKLKTKLAEWQEWHRQLVDLLELRVVERGATRRHIEKLVAEKKHGEIKAGS